MVAALVIMGALQPALVAAADKRPRLIAAPPDEPQLGGPPRGRLPGPEEAPDQHHLSDVIAGAGLGVRFSAQF